MTGKVTLIKVYLLTMLFAVIMVIITTVRLVFMLLMNP